MISTVSMTEIMRTTGLMGQIVKVEQPFCPQRAIGFAAGRRTRNKRPIFVLIFELLFYREILA